MDIILNKPLSFLPIVALLASPSVLKPYWPAIVDFFGGDSFGIFVYGLITVHVSTLLIGNLLLNSLHYFNPSILSRYKFQSKSTFVSNELLWFGISITLFNVIVISLPAAFVNYYLASFFNLSISMTDFPDWITLGTRIFGCMVVEDTLFYWTHRLFHTSPFLYKHVHKIHHKFTQPIAISAECAHPVEYLFGNVLPFAAPVLLLRCHGFTALVWTVVRISETMFAHCGYELPFFPGKQAFHDQHHEYSTGNYSTFFHWWDVMMGTCIDVDAKKQLKKK
jgi:fatty acid hydroxylase domain-containing protein 2